MTATQQQTSATQRTPGAAPARGRRMRGGAGTPQNGAKNGAGLARGLGWFSLGLGLAQVAAPRRVARMIGVRDKDPARNAMVAIGLREIASGVGILTRARPAWLWARAGGDMMDLALLGSVLGSRRTNRSRVAAATAAVAGVTALDMLAGRRLSRGRARARAIQVTQTITVNRPPEEVYRFWRDFENLPRFMEHLESVRVLDERRSHWRAKAPAGTSVEWDAEITDDRPDERISWRSLEGASVPNAGSVRFVRAPGDWGTEVHVELQYHPPGGAIGAAVAKLFGEEPGQQVADDLRRFKQVIETGEVVKSDASIHRGPHPARPPAEQM